jgi:hypothetical protein
VIPRPATQVKKDFPAKATLKYGGLFQTSVLTKGKGIIYIYEFTKKKLNLKNK